MYTNKQNRIYYDERLRKQVRFFNQTTICL